MKQIIEKHPLAIRWFHWVNFPVLSLMIWSGIWIYWANDVYRLGWGDTTLFKFFPKSFYQAFHVNHKLAQGMAWHFVLMWVFFLNGLLYVLYTLFSGEWRYLLPNRHSFREAVQVVLHDLGLRKGALPARKYNGAQQIAYTSVVLMGAGSLLSGLAIYKPVQFSWLVALHGGYEAARVIHFVLTIGYVLFFIVHVAQVVRAGWNNFRSMVAGFEMREVNPVSGKAATESASLPAADAAISTK
ncbi:cytochrome b/b6 domain-containing protein [Hymenobacter arizonensis]|uniref:Thiosulfate reductase cytochrome b subunit n=1 Tax=Hymenobacter arizonensis TaxID=1227077 RepID=A0A1I5T6C5_HYMAR|nr:cytochrome b/b6 domain-containing protein [Hymenobacter arizonensis]SFP78046.1 Thiosulfate reductase cytochrome b subunit [Hymenobacter arizonensis]